VEIKSVYTFRLEKWKTISGFDKKEKGVRYRAREDVRSMRIDVVHIANSDVYGFVWIRFCDSLCLSIEGAYWVSR
jgi:hypothetical protein